LPKRHTGKEAGLGARRLEVQDSLHVYNASGSGMFQLGEGEARANTFSRSLPAWMRSSRGDTPDPSREIIADSAPSSAERRPMQPRASTERFLRVRVSLPTAGKGNGFRGTRHSSDQVLTGWPVSSEMAVMSREWVMGREPLEEGEVVRN
jgi:hypothetical protein